AKEFARKLVEVKTSRSASLKKQTGWVLVSAVDPSHCDPALAVELAQQAVTDRPGDGAPGLPSASPAIAAGTGSGRSLTWRSPRLSAKAATALTGSSWLWLTGNSGARTRPASGTTRPHSGWRRIRLRTRISAAFGQRRRS